MQNINFETVIKDGYIKLPEKYSRLNNKTVFVEVTNRSNEKKADNRERIKKYILKYKGLLKHTNIPQNIDTKKIRQMRIEEKYGL